MKILLIAPRPNIQGPLPKHTPVLINSLVSNGSDVTFMGWGCHSNNENIFQKTIGRVIDAFSIKLNIKKKSFNILVLKTGHNFPTLLRDILLLSLVHNCAKKISIQFHGSQSNKLVSSGSILFKWLSRWLLSFADSIIVLSNEEKDQWQRFSSKTPCFTTANPFNPPNVCLNVANRSDSKILFVGRLIEEKGILDLIDAFNILLQEFDCTLTIAGEGRLKEHIEEIILKRGLTDRIKMVGYVKDDELFQLYESSTVLVLPTYFYEGFPTVITEAMYMCLPIVTTSTRGARDYLREGENALFVPPKDSRFLANSISQLLKNKPLREQMGKNNKELVKEFLPEKIGNDYFNILQETIAQN